MSPESDRLFRIAEDIADGRPVSWTDADSEGTTQGLRLVQDVLQGYAEPDESTEAIAEPLDSPPRRVGRFEIEGELGRGGMGIVYLARDTRLERRVAIKTLPRDPGSSEAARARFEREARLLASLNHPHIATVHALEQQGERRYLVLEHIEGETLARRLKRGPLSPDETVRLGLAIADALQAAHEIGVIHRDIKPSNVMIDRRGRARLLDFGLARTLHGAEPTERAIVGTAGYVSPERLSGREDARADLFSLGAVLYECVTGSPAFPGRDSDAILRATLDREPDWSLWPASAPPSLRTIVQQCLAKDPDRRARDAHEVLTALATIANPRGSASGAPSGAPHRLPRLASGLVGRDALLIALEREMDDSPLLTLTGVGGVGKTRAAVELAWRVLPKFLGGAWFVDLAPVPNGDRVAAAVMEALGIRESHGAEPQDAIVERLTQAPTLLVLDNCEHVLDGVVRVARTVLDRAPSARILATTREPLRIDVERLHEVTTLSIPGETRDPAALERADAAHLFLERARELQGGFTLDPVDVPSVVTICRAVDGIPLALELAASRIRVLGLHEIANRLSRSISLLGGSTRSSTRRHRTMRAAIGWSYDYLTAEERSAFRALSVFVAGCDLESARAVVGESDEFELLDRITRLADKSLLVIQHRPGGPARYRLSEPVRQFAREMLERQEEAPGVESRFLRWAVELAERAEIGLQSPEELRWLDRMDLEHGNLLAALATEPRHPDVRRSIMRITAGLWRYWFARGQRSTSLQHFERALAFTEAQEPSRDRARLLVARYAILPVIQEHERSGEESRLREAVDLFRMHDDRSGLAVALNALGMHITNVGRYEEGLPYFEESSNLYESMNDVRGLSAAQHNLARSAWLQRDLAKAEVATRKALENQRRSGNQMARVNGYLALAFHTMRRGERVEAAEHLAAVLEILHAGRFAIDSRGGALLAASEWLSPVDPALAASLLGAAEVVLERLNIQLNNEDPWWYEHDATRARLETALGAARYSEAWREGGSWTGEDAVVRALESLREAAPRP